MFRELRRKRQALSRADCEAVLSRGTSGVLALAGDDGYPYAVPLSYLYEDGKLLFHCAKAGHKLDAVARCDKASFCVIDQDRVVPEEYTTYFRSVIVFGQVRELTDAAEKRAAVLQLSRKYVPNASDSAHSAEADRFWASLCMLELVPEQITGKQAKELAGAAGD